MHCIKELQPLRPPEEFIRESENVCILAGYNPKPAGTAIRGIYKDLNKEDIQESLEAVIHRFDKAKRFVDTALMGNAIRLRAEQIESCTQAPVVLDGFAANNMLFHVITSCESVNSLQETHAERLIKDLKYDLGSSEYGDKLITIDEINEVISKMDQLYPGLEKFLSANNMLISVVDAYKLSEDGLFVTVMPAEIAPIPNGASSEQKKEDIPENNAIDKAFIFLFKAHEGASKKAVFIHEICHLLYRVMDDTAKGHIDEAAKIFADIERAERDGENYKEELIVSFLTYGIMKNDVFPKDEYYEKSILNDLPEKIAMELKELTNILIRYTVSNALAKMDKNNNLIVF